MRYKKYKRFSPIGPVHASLCFPLGVFILDLMIFLCFHLQTENYLGDCSFFTQTKFIEGSVMRDKVDETLSYDLCGGKYDGSKQFLGKVWTLQRI